VIRLRPAAVGDADAMAQVYARAVRGLGARDYAPEQVEAWAGQGPTGDGLRRRLADGRRCWVAVDADDRVCAFVDLEADGHIDLLYAAPEAAGTGVASRLLDELERAARQDGLRRLYVEASEGARRVFLKRGYADLGRRDFTIAGVAIHNYAMELRL